MLWQHLRLSKLNCYSRGAQRAASGGGCDVSPEARKIAAGVLSGCPMDCSPPGSSVTGRFQARTLEWVAVSFSGNLSNPGIEPESPVFLALQAGSLPLVPSGKILG